MFFIVKNNKHFRQVIASELPKSQGSRL